MPALPDFGQAPDSALRLIESATAAAGSQLVTACWFSMVRRRATRGGGIGCERVCNPQAKEAVLLLQRRRRRRRRDTDAVGQFALNGVVMQMLLSSSSPANLKMKENNVIMIGVLTASLRPNVGWTFFPLHEHKGNSVSFGTPFTLKSFYNPTGSYKIRPRGCYDGRYWSFLDDRKCCEQVAAATACQCQPRTAACRRSAAKKFASRFVKDPKHSVSFGVLFESPNHATA